MPSEWYCQIDGTEYGPLTSGQLRKMALDGRLSRKALVRKGPTGGWLQADRLKGLFDPAVSETAPASQQAPQDTEPVRKPRVGTATLAASFVFVLVLGVSGWMALKGSGTKQEAANPVQARGPAPTPNALAAKDETSKALPGPTAPRVGTEAGSDTSPNPTPKADLHASAPRSTTARAKEEDRSIETTNRPVARTADDKQSTARLVKVPDKEDDDKTSRGAHSDKSDDQEGSWRIKVISSSRTPPGQSVTIMGRKQTPEPNRRFVEVACLIEPCQAENRFFDTSQVFLTPSDSENGTKLSKRFALTAFGSSRDKGRPPSAYWPVTLRMVNSSVTSGDADEKVQFDVTMKEDKDGVVGALLVAPKDGRLPVSLLFEAEAALNGDWTLHFAGQRLRVNKGGDVQVETEIKKDDGETFQGKWALTSVTLDAPRTTGFGGEAARKLMTWTFQGDTLKIAGEGPNGGLSYRTVWSGDRFGLFSLNQAKDFRFRLDESKLPKTIDVTAGNSTLHGNYSWDGEQLKVCLNLSGGKAPGELEVKKGTNHTLFVLKKESRPPASDGKLPATEEPGETPAFRRREAAPVAPEGWPAFSGSLSGRIEVRISNPNDFAVTAGLRSGKKGKDFSIPAGATRSAYVPNGRYDIYFRYSNDDEGIYQGDSFTLASNGVEIQIVKRTDGNYGIRKVK